MINIAIAGAGYWGPNLVRNFNEQVNGRLVKVCDVNPQRLKKIVQQYPQVAVTTDFSDLLSADVDAIVLATPTQTHVPLAMQALKAGKHVLIEKPFATSAKEAQQLIDLARRKKLTLMVDHVFMYTPAVRKIKDMCQRKQLGEIIYFDAVRTNLGLFQRDTNVVWDLAAHDVSIMLYCLGHMPKTVSASGLSYLKNNQESIAYATMTFDTHMIAHFHWSWLSPVKVRTILIGGDKKMVLYDDTHPSERVKVYDKGVMETVSTESLHDLYISYRSGDMVAPKLNNTEALKLVCQDFIDSIRLKRAPVSDGEFSLKVIQVLEAVARSLRQQGRRIKVGA